MPENIQRIVDFFSGQGGWSILSAVREGDSPHLGVERLFRLSQDIRLFEERGFLPVVGSWEGMHEEALFSPGLVREKALRLGKIHKQRAVLVASEGRVERLDVATGEARESLAELRIRDIDRGFAEYERLRRNKTNEDIIEYFLRPGDAVYLDPEKSVLPYRKLLWPSAGLFRFLNHEYGKLTVVPLLDGQEKPVEASGNSWRIPFGWIRQIYRLGGTSVTIS